MTEIAETAAPKVPTVYFIDDSATMREVIKIAFRRESMRVIACNDAASALAQFDENAPDAVITDVIMPGKDGYEVCQIIKKDEKLSRTPVILMSGVVDRTVAEKAIAARADELIRKPFQPQELIARVKNLLNPKPQAPPVAEKANPAGASANFPAADLSGIFAAPERVAPPQAPPASARGQAIARPAMRTNGGAAVSSETSGVSSAEIQKLRLEIQRIEMLVRKLQAELEAERQYVASLESHVRALQEAK
ncbi:MAG TPA: response regulator [Candidatus Acidoferrales bacterium]|nr:response regulator [Candidatus Acidoferrales bacterium]